MKLLLLPVLLSIAAQAQVHGTVVVYELTSQGFFIAADSRANFKIKPPEDNNCKIAAINGNVVFAATGFVHYPSHFRDLAPGWDAKDEAKSAVNNTAHLPTTPEQITAIANQWAQDMKRNFLLLESIHPAEVSEGADMGRGLLVGGIFAMAREGHINIAIRGLRLNNGVIDIEVPPLAIVTACDSGQPCASGETAVYYEFVKPTSDRAKAEHLPTDPLTKVIRLVQLTIEYDKTGYVNGPINALQLTPDGKIIWHARQDYCQEKYQ